MEPTYADSWSDMAQPCDMTYISRSSDFVLYLEDYLMYVHHTWEYESVWPDVWPQNLCRSLWPIFHGPVNLPYILKIIWCTNNIIWNNESEWLKVWPQNKYRLLWPIFHVPVILPYILKTIWCMYIITSYFGSMNQYDQMFDLKINVGHCDLYSMILPYILKTIWCLNIVIWDYESVWPKVLPQNKYSSLWPIYYGPVILRYILKTIWCMNIILWD